MGDISIIARRVSDDCVLYGWSGNGGYFVNTGFRLLAWYNDPEKVKYLFELGQTGRIGKPGSENGQEEWLYTHELTNQPFWNGTSERQIFGKIAFVDYGYFYDSDNKWYYVVPGPFRIKIPLVYIFRYLAQNDLYHEFRYIKEMERGLLGYILGEYYEEHDEFRKFLEKNVDISVAELLDILLKDEYPISRLFDSYNHIFKYFDDWVVVDKSEDKLVYKVRRKETVHIETINW